jgi:hypothetical protein
MASNRFLEFVPWNRLTRPKFLLVHLAVLAAVYGITTEAFAIRPQLPAWFVISGRKGSFFDLCLLGIFFVLAVCECSWASKHDEEGSGHATSM